MGCDPLTGHRKTLGKADKERTSVATQPATSSDPSKQPELFLSRPCVSSACLVKKLNLPSVCCILKVRGTSSSPKLQDKLLWRINQVFLSAQSPVGVGGGLEWLLLGRGQLTSALQLQVRPPFPRIEEGSLLR